MSIKNWYAIYTKARSEKKTAELLKKGGVEVYLPLHKTLRQWSDRKKWVEIPLVSSYVFVKIKLSDYFDVLNTPGVVKIISFEGKPVPIPEQQIMALQTIISENIDVSVVENNIPDGSPVEIVKGPLNGIKGEVVRHGSKQKIILKLDHLNTTIFINIPLSFVKRIKK